MLTENICDCVTLVETPYIVVPSQHKPVRLAWGTPVKLNTSVCVPVTVSIDHNWNGDDWLTV
jgi:hypothetical protein